MNINLEMKFLEMILEEWLKHRQLTVKLLVDTYFTWVKQNLTKVPAKGKTYNGFSYSINQEKYLRVFLEDGEVPIDNNSAEQSICGSVFGKIMCCSSLCAPKQNIMIS